MSDKADILFEKYFVNPETVAEIKRQQEEHKKKHNEISLCKSLVDSSYYKLQKAFSKRQTESHFSADKFWRSYFECAKHVLKKDGVELTLTEDGVVERETYYGREFVDVFDRYDVKYNKK